MTFSLLTFDVIYIVIFCNQWCDFGVNAGEEPPRVAQFASLEVYQGQSVELPCTVSASAGLSVCWHVASDRAVSTGSRYIPFCADPERSEHDGRHMVMIDRKSGMYNLKIDPVIKSDSGLYMCAILNDVGIAVLFGNGRLSVVDPVVPSAAPTCQFLAREILKEGEMVSAACFAASDGVPSSSLQWINENKQTELSQITVAQANQINWEVSAEDEETVYTCLERHIALETPRNCSVGPLRILYRPILEIKAEPSKPKIGKNVTITCSANGNPGVNEIQWYIEGVSIKEIEDERNYRIETKQNTKANISRLTLFNFRDDQYNSTIECFAENNQGTRNTTILFSKTPEKPKFSAKKYDHLKTVLILDLVALGMIVFFSVCVMGFWNSWRNLSYKLKGRCYRDSSQPHHVPL